MSGTYFSLSTAINGGVCYFERKYSHKGTKTVTTIDSAFAGKTSILLVRYSTDKRLMSVNEFVQACGGSTTGWTRYHVTFTWQTGQTFTFLLIGRVLHFKSVH